MIRPRRLRISPSLRKLVEEVELSPSKLVAPVFVCEGRGIQKPHPQLPTSYTFSVDRLIPYVKSLKKLGIISTVLFGVSKKKDAKGSEALNSHGPVVKAIEAIRNAVPDFLVMTDIALDPYTDHGHDGLYKNGEILNDETVQVLCEMSLLHVRSGAQIVAPSDMMDGRVRAIRRRLEKENMKNVSILAYTAKYASSLYGPFRDTLGAKVKGDKKSYQMNPANRREALRELRLDIEEGADMVMVKPASWYLDVIADFKRESDVPVAAYQVSGECAMIELGARAKLFDRSRAIMESTLSIKRAGADVILTYFAKDIAELL